MTKYREVEDPRRLARFSRQLTAKIRSQLPVRRKKTVGYPSGRAEVFVNFASEHGEDVLWWSSELSPNGEAYVNLIGRGNPDSSAYLLIDLQFNVPVKKFGRSHGGAFVEHIETGAVILSHRGIVTRGKSRVKRDALFLETTEELSLVATSSGATRLFLVASLDSKRLIDDISSFSSEIRRSAAVVMEDGSRVGQRSLKEASQIDQKLVEYFDEFSGKRRLPSREEVVVEVRHGAVVRELMLQFQKSGEAMKSQQVDFAMKSRRHIMLFEVKTSIRPGDLYTAIGQLSLHGVAASEQFPRSEVRKVMVIPSGPSEVTCRRIESSLGIEILTYEWVGVRKVRFEAKKLTALLGATTRRH